jgi:hypothetical protein
MPNDDAIDPTMPPSGTGCVECLAADDGMIDADLEGAAGTEHVRGSISCLFSTTS